MFAFTAYGIEIEKCGDRLAVVVPAAIALTALQITVVATDVPIVSYLAPTTANIVFAYIVQLLIALKSSAVCLWL